MSSEPYTFATAAAELETFLKGALPQKWRVQDAFAPLGMTTGVVLTYTQGNLDVSLVGQTMPGGFLAVDFDLILSTPETVAAKGWPRLQAEAVHLFRALDGNDQVRWTGAERGVLKTGESLYIVPIQLVTQYLNKEN